MSPQQTKNNKLKVCLQIDQRDCGIACLLTIINYYGGCNTLENLRKISGTSVTGTTMLGLYNAVKQVGFEAEGFEANITELIQHPSPVILHVLIENRLHYIVCFGTIQKDGELKFIIGDPAKGIFYLNSKELEAIWQSKACLTLTPNKKFVKAKEVKNKKKKWIFNLVKQDIPLLSIAASIGIVIAIFSMAMALFSQRLVDEVLPKKDFSKLYAGTALVFLLLLVKEGFSYLRQFFLLRQSKNFNTRIIDYFYNHLLALPKPFFDSRKIGELTARLNDTSRIQRVISQLAGNVIIDVLVAIVVIIFLFFYSWKIALASLLVLPVYFLLIYRNNESIIQGQCNIMGSYALSEANYISTLQGIESIKNYNKQNLFAVANKAIYENFQGKIFSLGKIQIRLSLIANSFGVLFLLSVLCYTSYQVMNNHLKTGELLAILSMCSTLLPSVANLALVAIPIKEATIAFDRMFEFTSIEPERETSQIEIEEFEGLFVQNLSFRFPGRTQLLKGVSFQVQRGEIIAIMGENGCGKSTLSQIIQQHYTAESGSITVNGTYNLSDASIEKWRKLVAAVPQNIHIFNGTVLENIAFDDAVTKTEDVLKFLLKCGFTSFIDSLPQSFMTLVGEEGVNLSGGQKQMIALARALYHKPQLLILDEATAAMDRQSERFVLHLLKQLKKEMGIIFITHRLHVLKSFCDRIYILENGTITTQGNHDFLLQSTNLYSKYWEDLVS